jgi:DNA-binding NarL/FixJ family response regulator
MFATTSDCIAVFSDDTTLRSCLADTLPPSATSRTVVVIDWRMRGALRLCTELTAVGDTGVVMVAVPVTGDAGIQALSAGAAGIVYQSQPASDVARAVEVVARQQVFAPRHVVVALWTRFRAETERQQHMSEPDLDERLSGREREVYRHTAAGLSNKELADRLSISEATVKVHLTHIFRKLGVRSRGELAAAYFASSDSRTTFR